MQRESPSFFLVIRNRQIYFFSPKKWKTDPLGPVIKEVQFTGSFSRPLADVARHRVSPGTHEHSPDTRPCVPAKNSPLAQPHSAGAGAWKLPRNQKSFARTRKFMQNTVFTRPISAAESRLENSKPFCTLRAKICTRHSKKEKIVLILRTATRWRTFASRAQLISA